jgi:hypothetical protein
LEAERWEIDYKEMGGNRGVIETFCLLYNCVCPSKFTKWYTYYMCILLCINYTFKSKEKMQKVQIDQKIKSQPRTGRVAREVDCLPSNCEALSSNSSTKNKSLTKLIEKRKPIGNMHAYASCHFLYTNISQLT